MQERFPQYEFEAGAEEKSLEEIDNTKVGPSVTAGLAAYGSS